MLEEKKLLVVVGSGEHEICSIGSFARAEAESLKKIFRSVEVLAPNKTTTYPDCSKIKNEPDFILFHAPALFDRKKPWNVFSVLMKIRKMYPNAKMSSVVHEFSEAPWHWKIRQKMINAFCDGIIVNSRADFDGVRQKTKPVIRTTLGPTLYIESLLKNPQAESIASTQKTYRQEMITAFGLPSSGAWVLHPGLVTPGKGVNVLKNFEKALRETDSLIVMGGLGPKQRDRDYAQTVTDQLKSIYGQRFVFLENLSDDIFQKMLLSSDLVLLPYDEGVSERRSSFLSALSCGANVWTTLGVYSPELKLEVSGVHSALISAIGTQALSKVWAESVRMAIDEDRATQLIRRKHNLEWANSRSWSKRTANLQDFFHILSKKP